MPAPPDACLDQADGRAYLQRVADEFGQDLLGSRTGPGSTEVTLAFDADASVESVCLGPTQGETVSRRAQAAAAALRELPPGPSCLIGRRLVLAWESPEVTHEEIMAANAACEPATSAVRYRLAQCRLTQACAPEHVAALEREREEVHSTCVLSSLPLTLSLPGQRAVVNFRPSEDVAPTKSRALSALDTCEGHRDHGALVDCMREHGWEPAR